MAISVISSEKKTTTGNITIPVNCDYVVALVSGATNPTINLVAMTQCITKGALGIDVSISVMSSPPTGTIGCTVSQETRFVYLSGGGAVRDADGSIDGSAVTLTSTSSDLILGVQTTGGLPPSSMTVDGSNVTFLDNYYTGYLAAPDTSVVCDGDGTINAFISIIDSGAVETGDGTMICWIN